MKKITYTIALLLAFITSHAQKDFQGMAVYESKTSTSDFKKRFEGNKDITPEIAAESVSLMDDFHGDPADRIIVATAKCYGATLLTRDQKILSWADLGHIRSLSV